MKLLPLDVLYIEMSLNNTELSHLTPPSAVVLFGPPNATLRSIGIPRPTTIKIDGQLPDNKPGTFRIGRALILLHVVAVCLS